MKILCYFGHPAQFLFFKESIKILEQKNHQFILLIKTKDVLEELIQNEGFQYTNILPKTRSNSKFSIIFSLIKRTLLLTKIILFNRPDLMISSDPSIQIVGKLFNIPRINVTEDDYEIIKPLADIANPLTNAIICPEICTVGKWKDKKIGYNGFMKLSYLHPKYFSANKEIVDDYKLMKPYIIIRLAHLSAFHDVGVKGISQKLVTSAMDIATKNGYKVYISSEAKLSDNLLPYQLNIKANHIHHILANSHLLVSDSQSMSVEAAMLGIPSVRFSDFTGKISVLEELEHKYKLTFGVPTNKPERVLEIVAHLLSDKLVKETFQNRREIMLNDKINVTDFLVWFIEEYPNSQVSFKNNPSIQYQFK